MKCIWKKINLKVCRNFGDTCQRLQVNKFIALLVVYFAHPKNEFHSITLNMVYSITLNLHVDMSIWEKKLIFLEIEMKRKKFANYLPIIYL